MPVTEQGSCDASAALSLGGSESDLRLDRLSARAKQAGADHQGPVVYQRAPDQKQVEHPYNRAMPVSLGTDRLLASSRLDGRRVRHRLQPGVGRRRAAPHRRPLSRRSSPALTRLTAIFGPQHGFRSGRAGKHDRDRARATTRRAACRSTRSTARRASRPPRCSRDVDVLVDRSAGRRHADLHLHLHDGELPAWPRGSTASKVIVCDRPNPIGGDDVEGPMLVHGFESFVGHVSDPDAARHDDRRARAAVQRAVRHRRRRSRSSRWRAGARRCTSTRPGSRSCCRRRTSRRSTTAIVYPGDGAVRRHATCPKGAGRRSRSSCSARRGSDAERFADAMNALGAAGRAFPSGGLRADVPQARADQLRRLSDPRARPRGVPAGRNRRRAHRRVSRRRSRIASAWRDPPYEYEHTLLPIDILAGIVRAARAD